MRRELVRLLTTGLAGSLGLSAIGTAAAAPAKQPVELTVLTWMYDANAPVWRKLTEAFRQEHPEITFSLVSVPRGEQKQKLFTMLSGGLSVDVVWSDAATTNEYVLENVLEDLNPYLERARIRRSDYARPGFDEHTYDGRLFAFQSTLGTYFFFYNQDLFDRAGVAYPTNNWDFPTFLETAKKLRDRERGVYGVDNRAWITTFLPWVWANGGDWFTRDRRASAVNTPPVIEVQQFLADLIHVYDVHPPFPTPASLSFDLGNIAMLHGSTWEVRGTEQTPSKWGFRWSAALPPRGPAGQFTVVQTNGWAIPRESKHKAEAWTFIEWFNGPKGQAILAEFGEFPAYLPVARQAVFRHLDRSTRETILTAVNIGRPFPVNPAWEDSLKIAWRIQSEILQGQKSARVGLEQMAAEINARIQDYLKRRPW